MRFVVINGGDRNDNNKIIVPKTVEGIKNPMADTVL